MFWHIHTYIKITASIFHHIFGLGSFLVQYKCDKFCNKLCLQINRFTDFGTWSHLDSRHFYNSLKWKCNAVFTQSSLYDIHLYFQIYTKYKAYLVWLLKVIVQVDRYLANHKPSWFFQNLMLQAVVFTDTFLGPFNTSSYLARQV